jgi:hypothetical protein
MTNSLRITSALIAILATTAATEAYAQARPTITIGSITTQKSCKVYQESAGSSVYAASHDSAAAVNGYGGVAASRDRVFAASSWRTWLVKDCVNNFATIRTSLQAALAASGKLAVTGKGGKYVLSGAVSQIGGGDTPANQSISTGGVSISSDSIFVTMDLTLRDGSGRIVYGGSLTKHLETGSNIRTNGMETSSSQSGEAVYGQLQSQVALAVARVAAFHIVPLQVVAREGDQIRVNYGVPLVPMGMVLHAASPDGFANVRYDVTTSSSDDATAQKQGDGDSNRIGPGSQVTATEPGDPEGRMYQRVDLP